MALACIMRPYNSRRSRKRELEAMGEIDLTKDLYNLAISYIGNEMC